MTLPLVEPIKATVRLSRDSRRLTLVGRLKSETTIEQAKARFEVLSRDMQAAHPEEWSLKNSSGAVRELFVSVLPERDTRIHPETQMGTYAAVALVVVVADDGDRVYEPGEHAGAEGAQPDEGQGRPGGDLRRAASQPRPDLRRSQ